MINLNNIVNIPLFLYCIIIKKGCVFIKKLLLIIAAVLILSSCQKKETPPAESKQTIAQEEKKEGTFEGSFTKSEFEKMNSEEIESFLEKQFLKEWKDNLYDPYDIVIVEYAKKFEEGNNISFVTYVNADGYKFENGIFQEGYGIWSPFEFKYEKSAEDENKYQFKELINPEEGALIKESINKMARNDKELVNPLQESKLTADQKYRISMDKLSELVQKEGLKDYSHKIDTIPGYEKDTHIVEKGIDLVKDADLMMKKSEYDKMKKENEKDKLYDGVRFDKTTGIAVKASVRKH